MEPSAACIIGAVFAVICTILCLIFITPEKRRPKLNGFFRLLADIFNFKSLVLEKIFRVLYILSTIFCITGGFFLLFASKRYYYYGRSESMAPIGLLLMFVGPIAVRIVYEVMLMFVLAVNNIIQINRKLRDQNEIIKEEPVPDMRFCTHCGTQYDANKGGCPNHCEVDHAVKKDN